MVAPDLQIAAPLNLGLLGDIPNFSHSALLRPLMHLRAIDRLRNAQAGFSTLWSCHDYSDAYLPCNAAMQPTESSSTSTRSPK
jgi:hypothetical protein